MHKRTTPTNYVLAVCIYLLMFTGTWAECAQKGTGENASNPLAKVKNTDLRWQYQDLDGGAVNDFFIDGAFMANDSVQVPSGYL